MYKLSESTGVIRLEDGALIPADAANADYRKYLEWLEGGNTPEPVDPPKTEALIAANIAAIQRELDRCAQKHGYDDIVSACSYAAGDPQDTFTAEGKAFLAWRSATWREAYAVLADVETGKRPLPTPEEAVAAMPPLLLS